MNRPPLPRFQLLLSVIVTALILFIGCEKKAPPPQFQLFTDYGLGFTIEFPCAPEKTGHSEGTGAGRLKSAEFTCAAGAATYSVAVTAPMRPVTESVTSRAMRDSVISRIEKSGRVMKETKTLVSELAATKLRVKSKKAVVEYRLLDVAGRIYELRVRGRNANELDSDTARRFFSSFHHFAGEKIGPRAEREKATELDPEQFNKKKKKGEKHERVVPTEPSNPMDTFFTYDSRLLGFTIKMPQGFGDVKIEKRAVRTAGGALSHADLVITGRDGLMLTVTIIRNYFDTGTEIKLESFADNLESGVKVYRTGQRTVDGRKALFVHYSMDSDGTKIYANAIMMRNGNDMYQIHAAAADARTLAGPRANTFIESFHYTGVQP